MTNQQQANNAISDAILEAIRPLIALGFVGVHVGGDQAAQVFGGWNVTGF